MTNTMVMMGDQAIDAQPHILAANKTLKVIAARRMEEFIPMFLAAHERGGTGYVLRKIGEPMTDAEKRAAGIETGGIIASGLAPLLTRKARRDPIKMLDGLMLCAGRMIAREYHTRMFDRLSGSLAQLGLDPLQVRLVVLSNEHQTCPAALAAANRVSSWAHTERLPLQACDRQAFCPCSYQAERTARPRA